MIMAMVVIGVFIAVFVVNYGGEIDKFYEASILDIVMTRGREFGNLPPDEWKQARDQMIWDLEESMGLHQPFLLRCLRWTLRGIVLDFGTTYSIRSATSRAQPVSAVILARFPATLLVVGTANLFTFFASIFLALALSKRQGGFWDKLLIGMSPISSIPNWAFAIFLTAIFAWQLNILPAQGMYDTYPPANPLGYIPIVAKHLILPATAIFLSCFFQLVYSWRAFFLLNAGEDYVELAKAKGLPDRMIERRYIVKPSLPYILTNFTLMILTMWQGAIILEAFFKWDGIAALFRSSIMSHNTNVSYGIIITFLYLMAISVLILDVVNCVIDPRIKVDAGEITVGAVAAQKRSLRDFFSRSKVPNIEKSRWGWQPIDPGDALPGVKPTVRIKATRRSLEPMKQTLREILRYPSAVLGIIIILSLVGICVYTVVAIPFDDAIVKWGTLNPDNLVNPQTALPTWINIFRKNDLPGTIIMDSREHGSSKTNQFAPGVSNLVTISFEFDYATKEFPKDLSIFFTPYLIEKASFITLTWITPDNRRLELGGFAVGRSETYVLSQSFPKKYLGLYDVQEKMLLEGKGQSPAIFILFANPGVENLEALPGKYTLLIKGMAFDPGSGLDAKMVLYGKVFGWAGTDDFRRDLSVALLWGIPVALAFGLIGAVLTSFLSMLIAAMGTWLGGWVDGLIQRITEINMIIPAIPIGIMVYYLYDSNIWLVLGIFILLNIFGATLKSYRAALLPIKDSQYIEAARAYGASDWRIIWHYLVPRILPMLIPQLIVMVPSYIFLEATLAFLGVSDPLIPTWGKLIFDSYTRGVTPGLYYWILEPTLMIIIVALAFALVGVALDNILNPRLKKF
jgi:peptide/nickel transport system permease protein